MGAATPRFRQGIAPGKLQGIAAARRLCREKLDCKQNQAQLRSSLMKKRGEGAVIKGGQNPANASRVPPPKPGGSRPALFLTRELLSQIALLNHEQRIRLAAS